MTLCVGQLHPITVYRTDFWACVFLVLSVIIRSFYSILDIILFHHDNCDYYWDLLLEGVLWYTFYFTFILNATKSLGCLSMCAILYM